MADEEEKKQEEVKEEDVEPKEEKEEEVKEEKEDAGEEKKDAKEEKKDAKKEKGDAKKEKKSKKDKKDADSEKSPAAIGMITYIILGVVVAISAGAGFGLSRLLADSAAAEIDPLQNQDIEVEESVEPKKSKKGEEEEERKIWYYELPPVVGNLNEPGASRYIRASIILEMDIGLSKEEGKVLLDEKLPLMTDWLVTYIAGLTLEDVTGAKNLKHIQTVILDAFNDAIFPDQKPEIRKVLLKEFPIQ